MVDALKNHQSRHLHEQRERFVNATSQHALPSSIIGLPLSATLT